MDMEVSWGPETSDNGYLGPNNSELGSDVDGSSSFHPFRELEIKYRRTTNGIRFEVLKRYASGVHNGVNCTRGTKMQMVLD